MTLPRGWSEVALGDVAVVKGGRTPKALDRYLADNPRQGRIIPFYKVGDMNAAARYMRNARTHLAQGDVETLAVEVLPTGTVVFPKAGGAIATNKKRVIATPGGVDLNCMAVIPGPEVDASYLALWFDTFDLTSIADGSVLPQISRKRVVPLAFPLPPFEEQRRIVEILEDHLSRLDAGDAGLETAKRRLASFEASVLSSCRRGGLRPLAEVAAIQGGIQKQAKRRPVLNKFPFLRVANVTAKGLDLGDVHEVELFDQEIERYRLQVGDLLVVEGNGSPSQIGRAALWDGSITDAVHQNHLIRVRPSPALLPAYLEAAWNSPENRHELTRVSSSSSGLHTLSVSKLKQIEVPVPAIADQEAAIARLNELRAARASLDRELEGASRHTTALRRALLAAAFSGRLSGATSDIERVEEMAGV